MRVEATQVRALTVYEAERLDPILVILQDFGGGKGRIMLECYGLAWSAYWGAMGDRTMQQFLLSAEADYIASRMWPAKQRQTKHDFSYLQRIVAAAQAALKLSEPRPDAIEKG